MQAQTGTVKYRSTFQTIVRVTREESFLRLYRGLMTPLVTVALNNSVTFGVRGLALKYGISHRLDPVAREALAGLSAGFVRVNKHSGEEMDSFIYVAPYIHYFFRRYLFLLLKWSRFKCKSSSLACPRRPWTVSEKSTSKVA